MRTFNFANFVGAEEVDSGGAEVSDSSRFRFLDEGEEIVYFVTIRVCVQD